MNISEHDRLLLDKIPFEDIIKCYQEYKRNGGHLILEEHVELTESTVNLMYRLSMVSLQNIVFESEFELSPVIFSALSNMVMMKMDHHFFVSLCRYFDLDQEKSLELITDEQLERELATIFEYDHDNDWIDEDHYVIDHSKIITSDCYICMEDNIIGIQMGCKHFICMDCVSNMIITRYTDYYDIQYATMEKIFADPVYKCHSCRANVSFEKYKNDQYIKENLYKNIRVMMTSIMEKTLSNFC
jgi:hypothetical protein